MEEALIAKQTMRRGKFKPPKTDIINMRSSNSKIDIETQKRPTD